MFRRIKHQGIDSRNLELVSRSTDPGPLGVGSRVALASGGPTGLVVDFEDGDLVVVAWPNEEVSLPRLCLKRCAASSLSSSG